jgi:large subunit ribosomal protein L20
MRVTKGSARRRAKKRVFKAVKGFYAGRKRLWRTAKEALVRARHYAYRDRRRRKRDFRRLWIIRINAACRERGIRYSEFIHALKQAEIELDRKMLADLAVNEPETFTQLVEQAKAQLESAPAGAATG